MYKKASENLQNGIESGPSKREHFSAREEAVYRKERLERLRKAEKHGLVLGGRVKSVQSYGAFITLESLGTLLPLEGLVHISEIADRRVYNIRAMLHRGMVVRVVVLHVNEDGQRISLSMRQVPK